MGIVKNEWRHETHFAVKSHCVHINLSSLPDFILSLADMLALSEAFWILKAICFFKIKVFSSFQAMLSLTVRTFLELSGEPVLFRGVRLHSELTSIASTDLTFEFSIKRSRNVTAGHLVLTFHRSCCQLTCDLWPHVALASNWSVSRSVDLFGQLCRPPGDKEAEEEQKEGLGSRKEKKSMRWRDSDRLWT